MTTRDDAADSLALQRHARGPYRSVQERYVAVREIVDDVLCLAPLGGNAGTESTRERRSRLRPYREYRAILDVSSVNYALKSEGEQEAITISYQAFLNALAFPVQVLVRVVRLDLAPYLGRLDMLATQHAATRTAAHQDAAARSETVWHRLARDHADFVRDLAARRTLLERRFYLIVPADGESASGLRAHHSTAGLGSAGVSRLVQGHRRRVRGAAEEHLATARQQLDLRTSELIRQLGRIGLEARRLHGPDLAALSYSCLTPARAAVHPLPASVIAGANALVHVPHAAGTQADTLTSTRPDRADTGVELVEGEHLP